MVGKRIKDKWVTGRIDDVLYIKSRWLSEYAYLLSLSYT